MIVKIFALTMSIRNNKIIVNLLESHTDKEISCTKNLSSDQKTTKTIKYLHVAYDLNNSITV